MTDVPEPPAEPRPEEPDVVGVPGEPDAFGGADVPAALGETGVPGEAGVPGEVAWAVVVGAGELADLAAEELRSDGVVAGVHQAPTLADLDGWTPPEGRWVALVVLLDHDDDVEVDPVVQALLARPAFTDARLLVVTTRTSLSDMSRSVDAGHIDGVVAAPWTPGNLTRYADAQVSRATLLAGRSAPWEQHDSELLRHLALGTEAAATELLELLESVLGPRPRVHLDKGVRITVPEERLNQVFLVLKGRVVLTVTSPAGEVVLHHGSTGPLVGLVALTEMQHSSVTARTTTRCEMVSLTLEQLDFALNRDPRVGTALMALTMRALSTRLRRSEQLHLKNATLSAELRTTVAELRAARAELVEQARMATLGELAAGVAHELNNPAATVTRGVDHLSADLRRLLGQQVEEEQAAEGAAGRLRTALARVRGRRRDRAGSPAIGTPVGDGAPTAAQSAAVLAALVNAEERDHVSTREERALRRTLAEVVPDPAMVRRLVAAGVHDPEQARTLVEGSPSQLARVESAAGIGAALRAVRVAGHHIATLVSALHSHARPDPGEGEELREPTQVGATVQDALRLLEHRLRGIGVEVDIEPDLPPVTSGPGLLTQVWTNLLANAADALARCDREGSGHITVRVSGFRPRPADQLSPDGPVPVAPGSGGSPGPHVPPAPTDSRGPEAPASQDPSTAITPSMDLSSTETGQLVRPGSALWAATVGPLPGAPDPAVRVEIEDDGPGVPTSLQEQIFAPRFTTKHGVVRYGLGLGLGIARSIVSRHGGRMVLDSEPGRTVFTVELPTAGSRPLTPPLSLTPTQGASTPTTPPTQGGPTPTAPPTQGGPTPNDRTGDPAGPRTPQEEP